MDKHGKDQRFYVTQTDVTLLQGSPVSGTKYTVLPATTYVRIITAEGVCAWTVQPNPLEVHITDSSGERTYTVANPVSWGSYHACVHANSAGGSLGGSTDLERGRAFFMEDKTITVTAEVTGGTVSDLNSRVRYARYI